MCQWFQQIDRNLREKLKKEWIAEMQKLLTHFPYPLFESTKLIDGTSTKPNSSEKKM